MNSAFDSAVRTLRSANRKLEAAKKPFDRANDALSAAQRKVDSLCTFENCYECVLVGSATVCSDNPACLTRNAGCAILRDAAYQALHVAQAAVVVPLKELDAAKVAVSVAAAAVDKARVELDIAKGELALAQGAFTAAQSVLKSAQLALEGVKAAVSFGLDIIKATARFLIRDMFSVRRMSFDVQLTTTVPGRVGVAMDAIILGKSSSFDVVIDFSDFTNTISSIATSMLDVIKRTLDRRRRSMEQDVDFDAVDSSDLSHHIRAFHRRATETPAPSVCECFMSVKQFWNIVFTNLDDLRQNRTTQMGEATQNDIQIDAQIAAASAPVVAKPTADVQAMAGLGMTQEQIDAAFAAAANSTDPMLSATLHM